MTNDVRQMKDELMGNSDDWSFRKAILKGDKILISKILFNEIFAEIKECYTDTEGAESKIFEDKISALKEIYGEKYLKYGIDFPEAINRIEKPEDIEKL